jgi:hypothetical protein
VAHHLNRPYVVNANHPAEYCLYAQRAEPTQPTEQLRDFGAIGCHVECEWRGVLDRVVVTAGVVAQSFQELELLGQLGRGRDIAGVAVLRDQRQCAPLAAAGDEDRRM